MYTPSVYDLKVFYNNLKGRIVRQIIREKILSLWPDCEQCYMVGLGYTGPYLKPFLNQTARLIQIMPRQLGVHSWPPEGQNVACLSDDLFLPLETNSVDRLILVHDLEFSDSPAELMTEIFRVLKSTGRLLIIVPNRMGLWARADWSPFGQGEPYSAGQVEALLKENYFVHEKTCQALFSPPFQKNILLRSARFFEKIGPYLFPALGGVHMIEATKQIYASRGTGAPVTANKALSPAPVKPVTNYTKITKQG